MRRMTRSPPILLRADLPAQHKNLTRGDWAALSRCVRSCSGAADIVGPVVSATMSKRAARHMIDALKERTALHLLALLCAAMSQVPAPRKKKRRRP